MLEASELAAKKGSRSKKNDLPDWAITLWEDLGKPNFSEFQDIRNGPLLERRTGLRRDDLVEILIDARALPTDMDPWMRGRLMGTNKSQRISSGA